MFRRKKPQFIRFDTTSVRESVKFIRGIVAGHASLLGTQATMLENLCVSIAQLRAGIAILNDDVQVGLDGIADIESSVIELLNVQRATNRILTTGPAPDKRIIDESAPPPLHDC